MIDGEKENEDKCFASPFIRKKILNLDVSNVKGNAGRNTIIFP